MSVILNIGRRAKESAVFLLYCGLLAVLYYSIISESGPKSAPQLLTYAGSLLLSYGLFRKLLFKGDGREAARKDRQAISFIKYPDRFADGLLIVCAIFIASHFFYLGYVPVADGILSNDYYDIMRIRQSVFFEAPAVFRYLPNIILKSLLPFLLLYYCVVGQKGRFWLSMVIATFYGVALMNKMFVVILYAPLMLYLLFNRRFFTAAWIALLPLGALALLVFVQNPQVRPELWTARGAATASGKPLVIEAPTTLEQLVEKKKTQSSAYPALQFVETIYLRVFVVPGQVVTVWFSNIPQKLPFANGCGYRLIAAIRGCEFRFFPSLVHDIENPILVREGVRGTMTAASFMEDYANFGNKGLVLSGIVLALLFALIARLFAGNWRWALILNFIPVAMMIELPLSTVLLTGGWATTFLLYPIFRARLKSAAGETRSET